MAFDLRAKFKVDDEFSPAIKKGTKEVKTLSSEVKKTNQSFVSLAKSVRQATTGMTRMAQSIKKATTQARTLSRAFKDVSKNAQKASNSSKQIKVPKINSAFVSNLNQASHHMKRMAQEAQRLNAQLNRIVSSMRKIVQLSQQAAHHFKNITRESSRLDNSLRRNAQNADRMRDSLDHAERAARRLRTSLGGIRMPSMSGITGAAGALAGAAGGYFGMRALLAPAGKAIEFEAQLSSIKALTGATAEEMKKMNDLAMDLGAKTKYSALEAAQGIEELLKAGLTPATVQAGGLEAALNLATAGGLDLAKAAEIMSTALNAYKDDAMSAADAANILAGTANASATSVEELQYSLAAVSAVAAGVGMSFKDTNIALGLFANNGLKGSDAGTSLKTMLMNLQPATKAQREAFFDLGLMAKDGSNAFFDATGKLKSLKDIAGTLKKSMAGLTDQQRLSTMETLFGSDAIRAANILFKEGAEGVKEFQSEMSKVTALDVAKEKMNNVAGAIEQFSGAMETMQIAVMQPMLPLIKEIALEMADFSEGIDPKAIQEFGTNLKDSVSTAYNAVKGFAKFVYENWPLISNTVLAAGTAFLTFKGILLGIAAAQAIYTTFTTLRNLITGVTVVQWGWNAALLANPLTWIVAGITALITVGVLLWKNWDTVKKKTQQLWEKLKEMDGVAGLVLTPIKLIIGAAAEMMNSWDKTKSVWANVWSSIQRSAAEAVNTVITNINKLIRFINKIPGVNVPIVAKVDWGETKPKGNKNHKPQPVKPPTSFRTPSRVPTRIGDPGKPQGFATGLERVPFDDFPALLHRNESVLTAEQSDTLRKLGVLKSNGKRPVLDTSALNKGQSKSTGSQSSGNAAPTRQTITINGGIHIHGAQKTTKEMARELVQNIEHVINMGVV
ncbi:phage tail tape measure protein [Pseudobacillus wudalianchiensis]|uniref:Phage tail tape measure protein n=1 Tax=Pseudobacillus wudalianchiensis TaxID=1743143 RepID=A0A1B9AU19_9BACI|nr:phage tail tape measure protein [Bacillus wudalianchiensis]OCA87289.1 phage tail tape measure protein [Bacillus wudalianchiensis]